MVARPKCPNRVGHCTHYLDEHTAKGGCMHRKESGRICGCTYTSGPDQGASPFGSVNPFNSITQVSQSGTPDFTSPKEKNTMTQPIFNIAGVAAELGVTPQMASAWHRSVEKTPEPEFRVNTGLELWTADGVEAWHKWVEARNAAAAKAKGDKEAAKAPAAAPAEDAAPEAGTEPPAKPQGTAVKAAS